MGGTQGCKAGTNEYGCPEIEPFQPRSQWLQVHGKPSQQTTEKNHAASSSHPKVVNSKELLQGSMLRAGCFCKESSLVELKKPESEWPGEESGSGSTMEEHFKSRTIYSSRCCKELQ